MSSVAMTEGVKGRNPRQICFFLPLSLGGDVERSDDRGGKRRYLRQIYPIPTCLRLRYHQKVQIHVPIIKDTVLGPRRDMD
jgi:hypothetical protein